MTSDYEQVLFRDGCFGRFHIHRYDGACLAGQPTAYVIRSGRTVWVVPGESVRWLEA